MKKTFQLLFCALIPLALCLLCGCSASDFQLPAAVDLLPGQQCALASQVRYMGDLSAVTPEEKQEFLARAATAVIHVASTDPAVAAVDHNGVVTAQAPGQAVILVSCVDLDYYAEIIVNVHTGSATPETATSESATPESATPESAIPESATPESATPESATPETATPESATPESATPETATPESATPESATPESATPQTATPESAAGGEAGPGLWDSVKGFFRRAGETLGNFFGGLFDLSRGSPG